MSSVRMPSPPQESKKMQKPEPDQFRCLIGKEWKPIEAFSKKNLAIVERKIRFGERMDPANTGMICRQHSENAQEELKCRGPCNAVKPLECFSRNTRRKGINWCSACIAWATTCNPGMTPFAAPNNSVSYDESRRVYTVLDVTDEVFDIDDGQPLGPVTGMSNLKLEDDDKSTDLLTDDTTNKSISDRFSSTGARSSATVPKCHFAVGKPSSSRAESVVPAENLPPHLRNASRPKPPLQDPDRQAIKYTAYDPEGRAHQRTKIPTVTSSTAGDSSRMSSKRSAWAKPALLPPQEMRNFQYQHCELDPVVGDSESEDEI